MGHYDKDKAAAKRAANVKAGLTAKGKPRKPRAVPGPHQTIKFSKKRKLSPPKPRPRRETPEQRRERGRMMAASPMALAIEERVAKRLRGMA